MRPNNLLAWFYMVLMGHLFAVALRVFMIFVVVIMILIGIFSSINQTPACAQGFVYSKGLCIIGYDPRNK
ncbi:MAG: hypothetical protein EOP83_25895 [Verrucomicrobiaceae bacterium]|nr:MAG: hypothetical protein EOP83_25895 [Verrucomicrobiaceae bacterium]